MTKSVVLAFISMVVVVMFMGCASKIPYQETSFNKQDKAMVYVYRLGSTRSEDVTLDVAVNSIVISLLYDSTFLPIEIDPGDTTIYVQNHDTIKSSYENGTVELKAVKAGEIYYIKAIVGQEGDFKLSLMDTPKAKEEIVRTSYLFDKGFKQFKLYKSNTNTSVKPMEAIMKEPEPIRAPIAHSVSNPSPDHATAAAAATATAASASSGPTASERIEKLHDLKQEGAITDEEYETLKAKVLAE